MGCDDFEGGRLQLSLGASFWPLFCYFETLWNTYTLYFETLENHGDRFFCEALEPHAVRLSRKLKARANLQKNRSSQMLLHGVWWNSSCGIVVLKTGVCIHRANEALIGLILCKDSNHAAALRHLWRWPALFWSKDYARMVLWICNRARNFDFLRYGNSPDRSKLRTSFSW